MFGLFKTAIPESVHFIDMREGKISFLLTKMKQPGSLMKVRFPLLPSAATDRLDVLVSVTACRPARGASGFICVAEPKMTCAEMEKLAETLSLYSVTGEQPLGEVRQTDRSRVSLRVLGREIPYYRAVAYDLSPGGIRLNCHGKLEPGSIVNLKMEMDLPGMQDLEVKARVAWTLSDPDGVTFSTGLQFLDLEKRQQKEIDRYLHAVAKRDVGQVTHRLARE